MIAGIKGMLESIGTDWVIVDIGSVSFQVFVPASTLSKLSIGQMVKLHTYLHVRDDNLTLYGFSSVRELFLFQTLTTVSGVGPRLGLTMLSAMDDEQLSMAIASGDADLLTSIPGVGKKTASRIVLELKDKIGGDWVVTRDLGGAGGNADVVAALTSLGYSTAEATRAVASLPPDSELELEEKVKLTLRYFGGQ